MKTAGGKDGEKIRNMRRTEKERVRKREGERETKGTVGFSDESSENERGEERCSRRNPEEASRVRKRTAAGGGRERREEGDPNAQTRALARALQSARENSGERAREREREKG